MHWVFWRDTLLRARFPLIVWVAGYIVRKTPLDRSNSLPCTSFLSTFGLFFLVVVQSPGGIGVFLLARTR
ncbi:Uncharacterized protein HZ326_25668 [Fusarium oxysporum f. sp. albedinis]|nr:Uncharacterized protein HZ326_25668 [Fusarium oxysporum f. sp. albedinis]